LLASPRIVNIAGDAMLWAAPKCSIAGNAAYEPRLLYSLG
jgi:hypothetical protein